MRQRPYHIAHVLPWPTVGGVECATLRIAQALEGERFVNTAFCLENAAPVRELFSSVNLATAGYEAVQPSYRRPLHFWQASLKLAREFRRRRVDLVHCSDLLAGFYGFLAGRMARKPVLCHVRCNFGQLSRRDQSFLWHIDKFAFVSRHTWQHFGYRVAPERGVVVYDGIAVGESTAAAVATTGASVRQEFGIPADVKIIGMVARVAPAKDYLTLAKAASRVVAAEPNVRFLIVGDYSSTAAYREHYKEVQEMLRDHQVAPYFIFTDFRADVGRFLSAMDIFVLSTHGEGLPLVILEAMAEAKPIVATAVGGIPEIVFDEKTGRLFPHGDAAGLAAQLLSLLRDPGVGATLGSAGREFVKTKFSHEQFANSMARLYDEMLEGPRRAAGTVSNAGLLHHAEEL